MTWSMHEDFTLEVALNICFCSNFPTIQVFFGLLFACFGVAAALWFRKENLKVCAIDPELKTKLEVFRFRKGKNSAAVVAQIDPEKCLIHLDEEFKDISLDDLREKLPEHLPRYIIYSYAYHHDGRVSYPLILIFISPSGCKPELQMMYAGSKESFVNVVQLTKVFELRSVKEMTEEWLKSKLASIY